MQKGTASLIQTFFAAVGWFHPDIWPESCHPVKCLKRVQSNPWYLGRAISLVLCPPQLDSNHHLHLFFPLTCTSPVPPGVRLPKWESCFFRKCWCRRVSGNCNTWLRMQLGWVSETDSLMESCWVKDSKHTPLSQATPSFKKRQLSSEIVRNLLCFPYSYLYSTQDFQNIFATVDFKDKQQIYKKSTKYGQGLQFTSTSFHFLSLSGLFCPCLQKQEQY